MLSSYNNVLSHVGPRPVPADRRWKPNVEIAPNCPRCDSSNTKFCYYNNYSLSQPRYFCKGCRRYWTKGGSLRNVPVGGGCRKSRRGRTTRNSSDLSRDPTPLYAQQTAGGAHALPDNGSDGALQSDSSGSYQHADHSAHNGNVDGSNIDLAALYAKYLNQCPQPEPAGTAEPMDSGGSSSASSCDRPQPQLLAPGGRPGDFANQAPDADFDELLLATMNQEHVVEGIESASLQDHCSFGYSSLAMFMEANCFPSHPYAMSAGSLMQEVAECDQEFESVPPVDCTQLPLHQSFVHDINIGDQWSALDYSTLEGLYKL